jgi:hypothetical protein
VISWDNSNPRPVRLTASGRGSIAASVAGGPRRRHKDWLDKRIIWRLQTLAAGNLTERARPAAAPRNWANDADLRRKASRRRRPCQAWKREFRRKVFGSIAMLPPPPPHAPGNSRETAEKAPAPYPRVAAGAGAANLCGRPIDC